jgi:hypothetical protein
MSKRIFGPNNQQDDGGNGTMTNLIVDYFTKISKCKSILMGSWEHVRDGK